MWVLVSTVQHTKGLVVLDKAHPAHVGCKLENAVMPLAASMQESRSCRFRIRFSAAGFNWYQLIKRLISTARTLAAPSAKSLFTK